MNQDARVAVAAPAPLQTSTPGLAVPKTAVAVSGQKLRSMAGHPAAPRTSRDASFSATVFGGLALLLHPLLPAAVASAYPIAAFTIVVSGVAFLLHRVVNRIWSAGLGDIARDQVRSLQLYLRTRRLQALVKAGLISKRDANELALELVREGILGSTK